MSIHKQREITYDIEVWDGTNTEDFKTWVEQYIPEPGDGYTWVWGFNDDVNVTPPAVDAWLKLEISPYKPYWSNYYFFKGEAAIVGPLFDGVFMFPYTGINTRNVTGTNFEYEEVV